LVFSFTQTGEQAGAQALSQSASQSASLSVTCTHFNNNGAIKVFRGGSRDGLRSGSRAGARDGSRTGALLSAVDFDARKANQINGFWLRGFSGSPAFVASEDWSWGDASWSGDYSWTDIAWTGTWEVDPSSNNGTNGSTLENCMEGKGDFESVVTEISTGAITEGAVSFGAIVPGIFTATAAGNFKVNGVTLY
jgi:hypothetical protein